MASSIYIFNTTIVTKYSIIYNQQCMHDKKKLYFMVLNKRLVSIANKLV